MFIVTIKKLVIFYLLFTGVVLLMAASMQMNGFATKTNLAWELISSLRTILLWIGGVPTVLWLIGKYFSWSDEQYVRQEKERRKEIEKMIHDATEPLLNRCYDLSDRLDKLRSELEKIERERNHEKVILQELEVRQNRGADEATESALEEFI